jgi:hypothetical protein
MPARPGLTPNARQRGLGAAQGTVVALLASVVLLAMVALLVWAVV